MKLVDRIEHWPLTRLRPYDRNSRTHSSEQVDKIAASILEFGFNQPILVDQRTGTIVAGHGRLMAASKLGLAAAPVIVLDHLTDAQRRAYVIADNKLSDLAGWDDSILRLELAELDAQGFDISLAGFSAEEMDDLLGDHEDDEPPGDEDEVPDVRPAATSKTGDVWHLGPHRLVCGDATRVQDLRKIVADEEVECLWTDPPYNVAYEGSAGSIANDDMPDKEFREFLTAAFMVAAVALKPGGAAYVAHADGVPGEAFRASFRAAGFKLSGCLIWRKNHFTLSRSDYQWQHEPILYGWKEGAAHRWHGARNKTTIHEFDDGLFQQVGDNAWQIRVGDQTLLVEGSDLQVSEVRSSVMLEEKPPRNGEHPTMKPVPLIERMLANSTKPGDLVLDLFGGSGSTLIACHKTGRQARIVELDPRFVDVIIRRWQDYSGQEAVLAGSGQTFNDLVLERANELMDVLEGSAAA